MAHVLVIDDDPDVRELTQEMLEAAGHRVTLAENGAQGILACRRDRPDVVVTDLFMPDKEGIETIVDLERDFPGIHIIAMSGGGRSGDSTRYLSMASTLGVGAVLTKPFGAATLLVTVDRLLSAHDANEKREP
jgi:CheY-like chemotaxis protein